LLGGAPPLLGTLCTSPSFDRLAECFGSTGNELQYQSRNMPLGTSAKLLVSEAEACELLSLSINDLLWLTATEQLTPFFIRGHKLYEVQRLHEFIQVYKSAQSRSTNV
jgi:hypothetical protein